MKLSQLLREARERRGWVQTDLAYHTGNAPTSVSAWERGVMQPQIGTLEKLVATLGVDIQLSREGEWAIVEAEFNALLMYGMVPAGDACMVQSVSGEVVHLADALRGRLQPGDYTHVAGDDSMRRSGIREGDLLLVRPGLRPGPGHTVVALLADRRRVVRWVLVDAETEEWMLHPSQDVYLPEEVVRCADAVIEGVVIGRLRWLDLVPV